MTPGPDTQDPPPRRPDSSPPLASRWQAGFVVAVVVSIALLLTQLRLSDTDTDTDTAAAASGARSSATGFDTVPARGLPACPLPATTPPSSEAPLRGVDVGCLGSTDRVDLAAALAGQPTLINLWASWCAPCRNEIPVLDAYAREPDAIRVVGINVEDTPAAAVALYAELGAGYPSFIDDTTATQTALAAPPVLPVTYLVRADGSLKYITSPAVFRDPDEVRTAVTEAAR